MSQESCLFTVFLQKLNLIVVAFLALDSRQAFKMLWELISQLVQLSILSLAVKLKELTKFSKTCSELVLTFSERIGKSLAFAEFSYNNSFQSSVNMAPFEL